MNSINLAINSEVSIVLVAVKWTPLDVAHEKTITYALSSCFFSFNVNGPTKSMLVTAKGYFAVIRKATFGTGYGLVVRILQVSHSHLTDFASVLNLGIQYVLIPNFTHDKIH